VQAPGSNLTFAGTYQGEVFTGKFPGFVTAFRFDPKQLAASKLQVVIPLATAATSNADYDGELRGGLVLRCRQVPARDVHRDDVPRARRQPLRSRWHLDPARHQQAGGSGIHLDARRGARAVGQGHGETAGRSAWVAATGRIPR
jgi:hypothetical protein